MVSSNISVKLYREICAAQQAAAALSFLAKTGLPRANGPLLLAPEIHTPAFELLIYDLGEGEVSFEGDGDCAGSSFSWAWPQK